MLKYLFLIVVIIATQALAQPLRPGEWRAYTSMTSVTSLATTPDSQAVWVATNGGAFRILMNDPNGEKLALRTLNGLSTNELTAITVGPEGNVYIGGFNGTLDIYSPATGEVQSVMDIALSTLISKKMINRLNVTGERVYIAAGYGISIYDRAQSAFTETVTKFSTLPAQDTVFSVLETGGRIYVATPTAIAFADRNSPQLSAPFAWQLMPAPPGVSIRTLSLFNGQIIAAGYGGAFRISADTLERLPLSDTALVFDAAVAGGNIYFLDRKHNGRLITSGDLTNFEYSTIEKPSPDDAITEIAAVGNNRFAFGTSTTGVLVTNDGAITGNIFPDGPISNEMYDLYFSRSTGKLYVTHAFMGISSLNTGSESWTNFTTNGSAAQLPKYKYEKVFYDSTRSALWLSTMSGDGVIKCTFDGDKLTHKRLDGDEGLPLTDAGNPNFVMTGQSILDSKGDIITTVWAQNGQGLARTTDGNTYSGIQLAPTGGLYRPWKVVVEDLEGTLYAGTALNTVPQTFGVCYVTTDGLRGAIQGGSGNLLASPNVNALAIDQDNNLWCGTTDGVEIVSHFRSSRTGTLDFRSRKLPFPGQQVVQAIAVDGVGNKWIGTENGVFVLSPDGSDSLAHFTTNNSPLLDNMIVAITVDAGTGEVYIGTPKGISRTSSIYREGNPDYTKLYVYPNPVVRSRDERPTVTIAGLVSGSTIKIFTVSGRLIKTIDASSLGSTATWDGRDENGNELSSGVYVVGATSELAQESGQAKFVLIRK